MVEFVSYNGKYPNLCRGTLVIKVNGKTYELKGVLSSGGSAYFTDNYSNAVVTEGAWSINEWALPNELKPFIKEIEDVVNEEVEWGCCGGCI